MVILTACSALNACKTLDQVSTFSASSAKSDFEANAVELRGHFTAACGGDDDDDMSHCDGLSPHVARWPLKTS